MLRHADKKAFGTTEVYSCGSCAWYAASKSAEAALISTFWAEQPLQVSPTHVISPVSPHTARPPPTPPQSTSSSADMPDILEEPAYIPHMPPSCKEEQARHVTRESAHLSLYSAHVCFCIRVLFCVLSYVAEEELVLLCGLECWAVLWLLGEATRKLRWPQLSCLTWEAKAPPPQGHQGSFCPHFCCCCCHCW